jgi:hypothetical protein
MLRGERDVIRLSNARAGAKPLGVILYEGPSQLDGGPIVVIATGFKRPSANEKTGDMLQTWILRSEVNPLEAIHTGRDVSVCGTCPLRGVLDNSQRRTVNRLRGCYVAIHQAPRAVYDAYERGRYEPYDARQHLSLFTGRMLRLGAYGEPVAAPYSVWSPLLRVASGWTGYSHAWRDGRFWRFKRFLMASCETLAQAQEAQSRGWRTFRSAPAGEIAARGEFSCPASKEQKKRLTCEQCGACNGADGKPDRASVLIWAHGSPPTLKSYARVTDNS